MKGWGRPFLLSLVPNDSLLSVAYARTDTRVGKFFIAHLPLLEREIIRLSPTSVKKKKINKKRVRKGALNKTSVTIR